MNEARKHHLASERFLAFPPAVQAIIEQVKTPDITLAELLGCTDRRRPARIRHEAMRRIRAITDTDGMPIYSYPDIGEFFQRNHSSVIYAVRVAEKRITLHTPDDKAASAAHRAAQG